MRFKEQFARFYVGAQAALWDAEESRGGFASVQAADDALRVLEHRMNELERALVAIHRAIANARGA